jgi:hypothetical protein
MAQTDGNPVFQKDGLWYFYGAEGQLIGGWKTQQEANLALNDYLKRIP